MRRLAALVLLSVLALSACGGGGSDASGDDPSPAVSKRSSGSAAG